MTMQRTEKRRTRHGRTFGFGVLAGVAGLILFYLRCGAGFGLGPGGGGDDDQAAESRRDRSGAHSPAGAPGRCQLRVDATGLSMEGKPVAVDDAVRTCRAAGGADLVHTGDAQMGKYDDVRDAMERGGVPVYERVTSGAKQAPSVR